MSSIAGSKGLVAEEVGGDRVPWSTGRYCEKPDSGPSSDRICVGKSLILRTARVQIPYAVEQGNKSDEQGDKIEDQGIKSTEHGKARQVRSVRLRRPSGVRSVAVGARFRHHPCDSGSRLGRDSIPEGCDSGP